MIFVTIGSAFPYDRLIRAMDDWALQTGRGEDCLAQIGRGNYRPEHMEWCESLPENEFAQTVRSANIVVSHAGMGSAITALRYGTPIVMLPRQLDAGEHTTDHQMATARWLETKRSIFIAWDVADLAQQIAAAEKWSGDAEALDPFAAKSFTDKLAKQLSDWTKGPSGS